MTDPGKLAGTKPIPWYFESRFVFLMLFIFGPLALPLVWLSPKFSISWKIGVTILTIALTVLLVKVSGEMLEFLNQHLKEIQDASRP